MESSRSVLQAVDVGSLDVAFLIDKGRIATLQKLVVLLTSLAVMLDGFDGQLIGYAIPVLMKQWSKSKTAFAPAVAAGLVGMVIGSACAGLLADRFGRRKALMGSVLLFALATCMIGFAVDIQTLAALRFIAGLGIGGALPSATTITAEFMPARRRTLMITATIVCVPLGGMVAGLFAAAILPRLGWHALFFIGGLPPLLLVGLLFVFLPESPRFLARNEKAWPELRRLLARMSHPTQPDATFADPNDRNPDRASATASANFKALFQSSLRRDTLSLWGACFMCFIAVYSNFSWLPTMLVTEGASTQAASFGLAAWNLGGVLGALLCAVAVTRFGSRGPLAFCCLAAAASALALTHLHALQHPQWILYSLGLNGLFVNAVQSILFALCAFVYPTSFRATGTASALAFGRIGSILSAFGAVFLITHGGALAYFSMLAVAMILVLGSLMAGRRQIPAGLQRQAGFVH